MRQSFSPLLFFHIVDFQGSNKLSVKNFDLHQHIYLYEHIYLRTESARNESLGTERVKLHIPTLPVCVERELAESLTLAAQNDLNLQISYPTRNKILHYIHEKGLNNNLSRYCPFKLTTHSSSACAGSLDNIISQISG